MCSSLFMWYRWCRYSAEVSPDKSSAINEDEQVNHCGKYKEKEVRKFIEFSVVKGFFSFFLFYFFLEI